MSTVEAKQCFEYDTFHEGENKILKVYCDNCSFPPSVEDSSICMAKTIDLLLHVTGITVLILTQRREYHYDYPQTSLLIELAQLYRQLNRDERYLHANLVTDPIHERYVKSSYALFQRLISQHLKEDPVLAYVELKRMIRKEKIKNENLIDQRHSSSQQKLIT